MAFDIMTSSATKKGDYRNVAVVEWDGITFPKMLSKRARGMIRIVQHFGSRYVGIANRCQYQVTLIEANKLLESLRK